MKKRTKNGILAGFFTVAVAFAVYVYQCEGEFAVEFGDSDKARTAFIALLKEHNISYQIKTDHIGRVWIVPDRSKREEYAMVSQIWDKKRKEEVRKLNEADGL